MKTVGDFLKMGGVIVAGDGIDRITGCKNSAEEDIMLCSTKSNPGDPFVCIGGVYAHKDWTLRSFAWRANKGEKPSFDGLIEVELESGSVYVVSSNLVGFGKSSIDPVVKWRPSLNQGEQLKEVSRDEYDKGMRECVKSIAKLVGRNFPADIGYEDLPSAVADVINDEPEVNIAYEIKPTYTKAMYEAGDLPPFGSHFFVDGDEYIAIGLSSNGRVVGECVLLDRVRMFDKEWCKPIQTEHEKAIEEITHEWPHACKSTIELMIDAGYRKC